MKADTYISSDVVFNPSLIKEIDKKSDYLPSDVMKSQGHALSEPIINLISWIYVLSDCLSLSK